MAQKPIYIRWIKPIFGQTEKSSILLCNKQFSKNNKIKILKFIPVLLAQTYGPSWLKKIGINLEIIRGKLSMIRCDMANNNMIRGDINSYSSQAPNPINFRYT